MKSSQTYNTKERNQRELTMLAFLLKVLEEDSLAKNGLRASIALAATLLIHGSFGLFSSQAKVDTIEEKTIEIAIVEPPPPPEPEPEPEIIKPDPKPKVLPPPPKDKKLPPPPKKDLPPPPSNSEPAPDASDKPPVVKTGISLDSTTKSNSGFKVAVGNTTFGDPNTEEAVDPDKLKAYTYDPKKDWAPVRAAQVSREARVKRKKEARYPRSVLEEGIEGVVVMKIQVTRIGTVRKLKLVKGIHPKLDKLAMLAMKKTTFYPATVNGKAVDSQLTYRYRWEIVD